MGSKLEKIRFRLLVVFLSHFFCINRDDFLLTKSRVNLSKMHCLLKVYTQDALACFELFLRSSKFNGYSFSLLIKSYYQKKSFKAL